jgi:hypothetical protein
MSCHNGSVWPHDNAIIALGLSHYGLKAEASKIFEALFTAARYQIFVVCLSSFAVSIAVLIWALHHTRWRLLLKLGRRQLFSGC